MTTLYPTKGKVLEVDDKWSISYDPDNNDRPLKLFRYGEETGVNMHNEKNYVLAMFYRLLELDEAGRLHYDPETTTVKGV